MAYETHSGFRGHVEVGHGANGAATVRRSRHFLKRRPSDTVFGMSSLVELQRIIPGLRVELRYATDRNFVGRVLYPSNRAWLVEPVARRLSDAESMARRNGMALKVWDAYRPTTVHRRLWEARPDPRYVAPPERGSRHNRGASVDVTLVDLSSGLDLDLGTDFDDFDSPAAASGAVDLPEQVLVRRRLLRGWMEAAGFVGIASEWWHFDAVDWDSYPVWDEPV